MVYWYSLLNDGSRDLLSLHGGCPTAHGIKWGKDQYEIEHNYDTLKHFSPFHVLVSNKWIREGCQIWKKPCLASSLPEAGLK